MPGFEWIDIEEKTAVGKLFDDGGVLFAHGFDKLRKNYHVREFEESCRNYFDCKHALAVSSGTAALKIALKAVGVKPGDEVITQAFNFIATVEAIIDCGARPVIVNVDESLNMAPVELEASITKKTTAIIPVNMLGVAADLNQIKTIGRENSIPIVEDNCEAIGAKYSGKFLGAIGEVGILSFDQGKMIATGEGGMILTNNDSIDKYSREYHDHGHENNRRYPRGRDTKSTPGFNYRMTEMQAVVGKVQLNKLNRMLSANKERYDILEKTLKEKFELRKIPINSQPSWDTFIILEENQSLREKIINLLNKKGIGTKNLPDAMEWHCSFFWNHALPKKQIQRSKRTKQLLETAIAIPIWLRKETSDYSELTEEILNL